MPLRIACDLDGTVADMDAALQREAERLFGPEVDVRSRGPLITPLTGVRPLTTLGAPTADGAASAASEDSAFPVDPPQGGGTTAPLTRSLTDRETRQLWDHVRAIDNFWTTLDEIEPGAVARLGQTARDRRWEVIFLTQRPSTAGATAQSQSQRWLADHGFELPSVYVMNGSRGLVATSLALDAVIDDRPENCLDVVTDSKALSILVWRADPIMAPPGAERMGVRLVASFAAALDLLEERSAGDKRKGLIGRVRSALGWR
jgi:hypothetical protein